jgi:hypothetical protein
MTRDEAAAFLGARLGAYLDAASRTAADSDGNLGPVIDDALRALGYAEADLATAEPDDREGYELQLRYRALLQITLDLSVFINVGTAGESFSLQAIRQAAEKDLDRAEKAVMDYYGTLGVVAADGDAVFATLDTNINLERWCWAVV